MLSDAYDKGQEQRGQVKRDMEVGKERGKEDAQRAKAKAEGQTGNGEPRFERADSAGTGATATRPITDR
jgi:hypothetical protein